MASNRTLTHNRRALSQLQFQQPSLCFACRTFAHLQATCIRLFASVPIAADCMRHRNRSHGHRTTTIFPAFSQELTHKSLPHVPSLPPAPAGSSHPGVLDRLPLFPAQTTKFAMCDLRWAAETLGPSTLSITQIEIWGPRLTTIYLPLSQPRIFTPSASYALPTSYANPARLCLQPIHHTFPPQLSSQT